MDPFPCTKDSPGGGGPDPSLGNAGRGLIPPPPPALGTRRGASASRPIGCSPGKSVAGDAHGGLRSRRGWIPATRRLSMSSTRRSWIFVAGLFLTAIAVGSCGGGGGGGGGSSVFDMALGNRDLDTVLVYYHVFSGNGSQPPSVTLDSA